MTGTAQQILEEDNQGGAAAEASFAEADALHELAVEVREQRVMLKKTQMDEKQLKLALDAPGVTIENAPQEESSQTKKPEDKEPIVLKNPPPQKRLRLGEMLRAAREAKGWHLEDVAEEIKIRLSYLEAIEANNFAELPSRTHAAGFVRTYADILGLNGEEVSARLRSEVSAAMPRAVPQFVPLETKVEGSAQPGSMLVISGVIFALVAYGVGYGFFRPSAVAESYPASIAASLPEATKQALNAPAKAETPKTEIAAPIQSAPQPVPQSVAQAPAPQQVAPQVATAQPATAMVETAPVPQTASTVSENNNVLPAPAAAVSLQQGLTAQAPAITNEEKPATSRAPVSRIKLKAAEQLMVQIFDAKGRMLAERVIAKGEAFFVPDHNDYTMATNNAGALHVLVDGRELPPLGAPDEPVHNIPLNAEELLNVMN